MWMLAGVTLIGFVAQLIGGTIGMAFGVTATSGLLIAGLTPSLASSVVHFVEIGTSVLNGTFHARARNVDWRTLLAIGIPGAVGAFVGALVLSTADLGFTKPWTASLLLLLGVVIIARFVKTELPVPSRRVRPSWLVPVGLGAGFVDVTAGGGWGIITTSSLMASNSLEPARVVGTTTTARFLVAVSGSTGFIIGLGVHGIPWDAVLAMLIGGLIAAPIAAKLVRRAPSRALGLATGVGVVVLNVRQLAVSAHADLATVLGIMAGALVVTTLMIVVIMRRGAKRDDV